MIKKIILIILLVTINPITANAGWLEALGSCFSDFCNCGDSNKHRDEIWNGLGNVYRTVDRNRVCAPWNKDGGRDDNTCLIKKGYPGVGIGYYENLCGEETPESTYMDPKIRVRGQQCNFVACWTTSNTLSWDGQCVTLASGYGIPLHRMCARVAIPANYQANFPQDPGYTIKQHLNFEGVTVQDDVILGYDNQPVDLNPPKLCLYKDPAFLSFKDGFDLMDLDPNKQSAHKTTELHPVIKVLLFFVDMAVQLAQSPYQMLDALVGMIFGDDSKGQTTFASVLKDIFGFISWLIEKIGDAVASILRAIGQINRAVDDTVYGCVKIPMGPYPPPFCPTLAPFFQTAYTQKICRKDGSITLPSIRDEPCVFSTLENNFVRNAVRITFENFVPQCPAGVPADPTNNKCVVIRNLDSFPSASLLHIGTGNTDVIPKCTNQTTPCVDTQIPVPNSCINGSCSQVGFRIVYGLKIGTISSPQSYFVSDVADCPNGASGVCQEIWGVNTSPFADVSVTFPTIQSASDKTPVLSVPVSLTDNTGRVSNFSASVVRVSSYDPVFDFAQNPKQICVKQGTQTLVGCEDRPPFTKPQVYDCNSPSAGIACTSTYYRPRFVARITAGSGDSTSDIVEPWAYTIPQSTDTGAVNLGGFNFNSFVTDDTSIKTPFSGSHSPNPGSTFGTYLNNIFPVNISNGAINSNAIYLYGLEYINGQYYLGGKRACLENRDLEKCPKNTTNCVLTNLINRNTVNCETFINKLTEYPSGIGRCTAAQTISCGSPISSVAGIGGGTGSSILFCASSGAYCYTSPINADLCQISNLPGDRFDPSSSLGAVLSDSQYYNIASSVNLSTYNSQCTPINEIVNCTDFINKLALYPNTNLCTAEQTTRCSYVADTIPALISGNTGVSIRLCDSGIHCYTSPTNAALCQNSTCASNSTASGYNFDQSQYALRDKTSYEMNLCATIPQPTCTAITNYTSQDDGYAIWPATQVGQLAIGSCQNGYIPMAPLQRWCVPNPDTQTFGFSRLYTTDGSGNKIYSNVRCQSYQITLSNRTDTFPANYPRSASSNASDYSGNVTLGGYDYGGTTIVSAGAYSSTLTFNIPGAVSNIDYFRITSMANDDFALVKVNNVVAYSSPPVSQNCGNGDIIISDFRAMSYNGGTATLTQSASGGTVTLGDTCTWNRSSFIDLKPFLVQGTNTIRIDLIVIGGGGLHYSIDYKMNAP